MYKRKNVIDHYKNWETEEIKFDLNQKRFPYAVLCGNLYNDFNIATIIRNANAFLAKEIIIYGDKRYDRRGAVGTHHYENFKHFEPENLDNLKKYINQYHLIAIDNIPQSLPLNELTLTKKPLAIVIGQEQTGIPLEILRLCNQSYHIPQYGSVRSINVGTASGIVMHHITNLLQIKKINTNA